MRLISLAHGSCCCLWASNQNQCSFSETICVSYKNPARKTVVNALELCEAYFPDSRQLLLPLGKQPEPMQLRRTNLCFLQKLELKSGRSCISVARGLFPWLTAAVAAFEPACIIKAVTGEIFHNPIEIYLVLIGSLNAAIRG